MGRAKLKIKRLESTSNRQITYSKRRNGILKKAKELSILCGIDIVLLMFSPTEKPTIFQGEHSNIEDVIAKFAQLTPQERAKRKLESLEALKKTFRKLDHDVVIQDFLGSSCQSVEELSDQVRLMQTHLSQLQKRLSYWTNPDKVENVEHLRQMEDSLKESINQIRMHKENLGKCQLMPLDCNIQFQNGTVLPMMMQEAQPLSWLPNNGNQHLVLSNRPHFFTQRDMECSTDPSSLPGFSGYYDTGKQTEMENVDNMKQGNGVLSSNLNGNACLNSQLDEQFSYPPPPYSSFDIPEMKKPKQEMMQMNSSLGNHPVYQVNNNFELPRPIYDNAHHHSWVSASGPCSSAMFNETSFHQQSN